MHTKLWLENLRVKTIQRRWKHDIKTDTRKIVCEDVTGIELAESRI
jgi:hypothetical protein